ncbi:MAG: ArnT family glycosyltransferase [Planctomycetaceae bacterium]
MSLRSGRTWLWLAIFVACAMQLVEVWHRGIDPDELEHLHAGYCIFRGMLPYRDFFEHHGPLLYYAIQPLFELCGAKLDVLWLARLAMWLCSLATLAAAFSIGRQLAGRTTGLVTAALLAWSSIFHRKGIELRPDVPATLLVTIAFYLSLAPHPGRLAWRWLTIGLLAGAATLFTQKSVVPVAGLVLGIALREILNRAPTRAVASVAAIGLAGVLAWGTAAALFAAYGAATAFLDSTLVRLFVWPIRGQRWDYLRPTLIADCTVWLAAAAELWAVLRDWKARETWETGAGQTATAALFSILGLFWVKATYTQYYLLWLPLLAALAARRLIVWNELAPSRGTWLAARLVATLLIAGGVAQTLRDVSLQSLGSLPHLAGHSPAWRASSPGVAVLITMAGVAIWLIVLFGRWRWRAVVTLLAVLGMFHAAVRNLDTHVWPNHEQIATMGEVHAAAGPEESVLDGFSGYGALRPHAYYYWWINEYSLALMTPAERGPELLAALEAAPPAVVLLDSELERTPPEVLDWIRANYRPGARSPMWVHQQPARPGPTTD